jgi:hypothetical protein
VCGTKVGELDVALAIEKNVLGLEVTIDDVVTMQEVQRQHHLHDVEPRHVLWEAARPVALITSHRQR